VEASKVSEHFSIDTDAIDSLVPGWLDLAAKANGAVAKFQRVAGPVWNSPGADRYGEAFESQVGPGMQEVLQGAEAVGPAATNTGEGLRSTADLFAKTEQNAHSYVVSATEGTDGSGSGSGGRKPGAIKG
jgi:hypothetical protein